MAIFSDGAVSDGRGGVKAVGNGQYETIPVGLILRSVGYRGIPIADVPFDEKAGRISNDHGRVTNAGSPVIGQYVVGWAKRGPSGLIGTNRADSVATVEAMVSDVKNGILPTTTVDSSIESTPQFLARKSIKTISFDQWKKLDTIELAAGAQVGKIREKSTRVEDMLSAIGL
jgi:ferredoxin--NADP+ reductase